MRMNFSWSTVTIWFLANVILGCSSALLDPEVLLLSKGEGCFPAIFSFGSSVADTGNDVHMRPDSHADKLPYGITHFRKSSKRWSDGRLHVDIWATALRLPFLDSSMKMVGTNFLQGANFAAAGATARDNQGGSPITLSVQLHQFRKFKLEVQAAELSGGSMQTCTVPVPQRSYFEDGLHLIAAGGNDIGFNFKAGMPIEDIIARLPQISSSIADSVEALYAEGARHILVEDVYPLGCLAAILMHPVVVANYGELAHPDSSGCSKAFNDVVQMHNTLLRQKISALAQRLPGVSTAVVNTYSIRYDMLSNPGKYGFTYGTRVCCGIGGGKYNYDPKFTCAMSKIVGGKPTSVGACANVSDHVVWDGTHFTEAANLITMKAVLSGDYFFPKFEFGEDCILENIV